MKAIQYPDHLFAMDQLALFCCDFTIFKHVCIALEIQYKSVINHHLLGAFTIELTKNISRPQNKALYQKVANSANGT